MKNYYHHLSVSEYATPDEIKTAYRKLAKQWHPDRNLDNIKQAEEEFKKIQEAYDVLSNEKKREEYDGKLFHFRAERKKQEQREQEAKRNAANQKTTNGDGQYHHHNKSAQSENPLGAIILVLVVVVAISIILSAGSGSGSSQG